MISLEAYRMRVGTFQQRNAPAKGKNTTEFECRIYLFDKIFSVTNLLTALSVMIIVNMSFLKMSLLIQGGDIESNPGPGPTYSILKAVTGSYHQGNSRFDETAGTQCLCNALYAIGFSVLKRVGLWNTTDLDNILTHGDQMRKTIKDKVTNFLSTDDLPESLCVNNTDLIVTKLSNYHGYLCPGVHFISKMHLSTQIKGNGLVLIFNGYSISILWNKAHFFLFDPHSRDSKGSVVPDGTSVLLKFRSMRAIEHYLLEMFANDNSSILMDLQYIELSSNEGSIDFQPNLVEKKRARKREYMASSYDTFKSSDKYAFKLELNKRYKTEHSEKIAEMNKQYRTEHSENTKEYNKQYKAEHFEKISEMNRQYKAEHSEHASKINKQYKTQHQEHYSEMNRKYHEKNHEKIKENKRKRKALYDSATAIRKFKTAVRDGTYYICVICNRCFFKRSVKYFHLAKYTLPDKPFFYVAHVHSFDGKEYICMTCDKDLIKKRVPRQAVCNKLEIYDFPRFLPKLRRLERVLIAKRLLFKKIAIMPKGQSPKLKGAICNIPLENESVCDTLPRGADSNGIVMLKLKRKLVYRGHVYFEAVRPQVLIDVLNYLKVSNSFYNDITIDETQIPDNLLSLDDEEELPVVIEDNPLEEVENPLDEVRVGANETMLMSNIPHQLESENMTIAPGEGKKPLSLLKDDNCEELAHPHLFPTGKFGYKVDREILLSPNRYFNQRLLNYKQKFSSDADYIFFCHSVYQQLNMTSKINIAMQKVCGNNLTAGMLSRNFKENVKNFVANDEAYSFMSSIKGTPAYWKKFLFEVLAMVKQLGLPTFFMTLSCADLRWPELPWIISRLNGSELSDEEIHQMEYTERCNLLNSNPVLLARHFQYRVELFFKEIVINGPLGKVTFHVIRVEFQVRGSPHIHSFLWVVGAPKLSSSTIEEYIIYIDHIIKAELPDPHVNWDLFKLVKTYQIHSHSRSCRKYNNVDCRYKFGKFFTERTIVAQPLSENITETERESILSRRDTILNKVKDYIDSELDPRKVNIIDPFQDDFVEPLSISEILQTLNISEEEYYNALSISPDSDFQVHLKRSPKSCFVNNYFTDGLTAWEANMDIQPVINHYKAVQYMCAYFSKSEDESTQAMKQAAKEAAKDNLTLYEQMKSIARAYITMREVSVVEAVYHVLPELWLNKKFPAVIFINTNLPEKRFKVFRSEEELSKLPEDSTDVFKRNMLDRYMERPDLNFKNGKYAALDSMCFAEFLAFYYVEISNQKENINDNQPVLLEDELLEENNDKCSYPSNVPLMSAKKEKLKCRQVRAVLRYHVPNRHKKPEEYAHHMLLMYLPFRKETDLCRGSYMETLRDSDVLRVVNANKIKTEPFSELVDEALSNLRSNLSHNQDSYAQQENDEVEHLLETADQLASEENEEESPLFEDDDTSSSAAMSRPLLMNDDDINAKICSLNLTQRQAFDVVIDWARNVIKYLSSVQQKVVDPIYLFITGDGGCGKSHLAKTIFHSLAKTLSYHAGDAEKPKVIIFAPTGVAAINVEGDTIHSGLGIPVGNFRKNIPKLSDKLRSKLRNSLSSVKIILIDEVSMVDQMILLHIHQRLTEIFGTQEDLPFAGLSVIAFGDFYQLPPINKKPIYCKYNDEMLNIAPLWRLFKMVELTEVMRQKGDAQFIELLNKVRKGIVDDEVKSILKSKFISKDHPDYPIDAMHIWAENNPVNEHNASRLDSINSTLFRIHAIDLLPKTVAPSVIKNVLSKSQSQTGGLASILNLKVSARVMITNNIDVSDKLSNGQIGTVKHIKIENGTVTTVYVKLDDDSAGSKLINSDNIAKRLRAVPIKRTEASISIYSNKPNSPVIKRTQFPLMLAWACTVHKVQGKQFKEIVISFKLFNQRSFKFGQMYVALSRVTSLDGLYLIDGFNAKAIVADSRATQEYELLRKEYAMQPIQNCKEMSNDSVIICLLNTRSLSKHVKDIKNDPFIMQCDVLCLTETQIENNGQKEEIEKQLGDTKKIDHNVNEADKFSSLAMCYEASSETVVQSIFKMPGCTLMSVEKSGIPRFNMLLLYKKSTTTWEEFSYLVRHITSITDGSLDIVLGDINSDAFKENDHLKSLFESYTMIVNEPTHLSGSLLDHVYVKNSFLDSVTDVHCIVKSIFFSDHEVVKFRLKFSDE